MSGLHLRAVLEYDGTEFAGFQVQAHARSVQGELEKALAQVTGQRVRLVGGGRTDAGVHAEGQCVTFTVEWPRSLEVLQRALNAQLPDDLAIRELAVAEAGFSARYNAAARVYRYTIVNRPVRAPLQERYALHVPYPLDVEAMQAAAALLIGERDLGAFGRPPKGDKTVRRLTRLQVVRRGDRVEIELEANAFLYRMARRIVGTLLLVGGGRLPPQGIIEVLNRTRRAGPAVKPNGLCLVQVRYEMASP